MLHAPHLIKNLVYVRQFTIDNNVSVEFDAFGFSVKNFQTVTPIMRCNSLGDLYPITSRPQLSSFFPSSIAAISPFV